MKKIISLLMACVCCFSLANTACAAMPVIEAPGSTATETVTPREFVRDYENYYTVNGSTVKVVEDPNWDIFDDRHVTVALTETSGPTKCKVTVYYK